MMILLVFTSLVICHHDIRTDEGCFHFDGAWYQFTVPTVELEAVYDENGQVVE